MKINLHNYEAWFLDYLEGRLDKAQESELMRFLEEQPALKAELDELELVVLQPDNSLKFFNKETLKKKEIISYGPIDEANYESYFAAAAEGDLDSQEMRLLEQFLELNPTLNKEYELIRNCRLEPDISVVFKEKHRLKRRVIPASYTINNLSYVAAAASLVILAGIASLFDMVTVVAPPPPSPVSVATKPIKDEQGSYIPSSKPAHTNISAKLTPVPSHDHISHVQERELLSAIEPIQPLPVRLLQDNKEFPVQMYDLRIDLTRYFGDIMLAQTIRYNEATGEEQATLRLLSKGSQLATGLLRPDNSAFTLDIKKIDWWKVADVGINGFSALTNSNLRFIPERGPDGDVTRIALHSNYINLSREVKKNQD